MPRRQPRRRQSRTETLVIDHDHAACNQEDVVEQRERPRGWASAKVTRAIDIYFKIVVFILRALISALLGLVILACLGYGYRNSTVKNQMHATGEKDALCASEFAIDTARTLLAGHVPERGIV